MGKGSYGSCLGLHVDSLSSSSSVLRSDFLLGENFFLELVDLAEPEVNDLERRVCLRGGEEEVLRLEVSVADTMLVAVEQGLGDLGEEVLGGDL